MSSEYHRIVDEYGGLPRLFAIPRTGSVVAWGIEFPDGSAVTYKPGGGFGSWESSINAAALLGDGADPLYLTRADA